MPWFPLYAQDFLIDTEFLTNQEMGLYFRLLCYQWANDGIPGDLSRLRGKYSDLDDCWSQIKGYFELGEDGKFRNAKLEEIREESEKCHLSRVEAGRKGGLKAQEKRKQNSSTAKAELKAELNQSQSHSYSQSQSETQEEDWEERRIQKVKEVLEDKKFMADLRPLTPRVDPWNEFEKIKVWIRANPQKSNKKRWKAFVASWFKRAEKDAKGHGFTPEVELQQDHIKRVDSKEIPVRVHQSAQPEKLGSLLEQFDKNMEEQNANV